MEAIRNGIEPSIINGKKHFTIIAESECGCPVSMRIVPTSAGEEFLARKAREEEANKK